MPDLPICQRTGVMAAFSSFEDFKHCFMPLMQKFTLSVLLESESETSMRTSFSEPDRDFLVTEAIRVLNVAIRTDSDGKRDDKSLSDMFQEFCLNQRQFLTENMVRRVTFLVLEKRAFPKYFTFRARDHFQEDPIYRHLEPALAFQLEINRLKNFELKAIPTQNRKMHLYYGTARGSNPIQEANDYRYFLRCIIRHSDLVSKEASFEYMRNEGERILLESMDTLEIALSHPDARKVDCNHVFLNFVPCVTLDPQRVVDTVGDIVKRYGVRLWKLRVLQAELKFIVRLSTDGPPIPMRLTVSNESGYYLDMHLYRETVDRESGQVKFESWTQSPQKGPLHGLPISTPYQTKDHLQQKRYIAQKIGSTYVYDYPEMFRQALMKHWKEYSYERGLQSEPNMVDIFKCIELVLDSRGNLSEINRLPGENECGMVAWRLTMFTPEYPDGR